MSLKKEGHSTLNVTQNRIIFKKDEHKIDCHSRWNVTKSEMPIKIKGHQKWNEI